MEEYITLVSVPTITVLVYWIINLIKYAFDGNEKLSASYHLWRQGLGAGLRRRRFLRRAPRWVSAKTPLSPLIVGMASGLPATGANQVIKQLSKKDCEELLKEDKKKRAPAIRTKG